MFKKVTTGAIALALCGVPQISGQNLNNRNGIRRVLLISIDGMHALDYLNCVSGLGNGGATYCPNLAALGKTGVNYTRTTTSRPSDSFPGLMALVTGGTARLRPGTRSGPRHWSWFPTVVADYFDRQRNRFEAANPSGWDAWEARNEQREWNEEFARMTEAIEIDGSAWR